MIRTYEYFHTLVATYSVSDNGPWGRLRWEQRMMGYVNEDSGSKQEDVISHREPGTTV